MVSHPGIPTNWKDAPVIGDWIGRVGAVADIMATPCDPDIHLWVRGFFQGLPRMLWGLYKPTPLDAYFDLYGLPHSRKRRRRFRARGWIDPIEPPGKGWGTAAFRLAQLAQRIGWWFLIADMATAHAYNWASTVYAWNGCEQPDGERCSATNRGNGTLGPSTNPQGVSFGVAMGDGCGITGNRLYVFDGRAHSIGISVQSQPYELAPGLYKAPRSVFMICRTIGSTPDEELPRLIEFEGDGAGFHRGGPLLGSVTWEYRVWALMDRDTICRYAGSTATINVGPPQGLGFDP